MVTPPPPLNSTCAPLGHLSNESRGPLQYFLVKGPRPSHLKAATVSLCHLAAMSGPVSTLLWDLSPPEVFLPYNLHIIGPQMQKRCESHFY